MISVDEALAAVFALVEPMGQEVVALRDAAGRTLAEPVSATRAQPPFDASAMDGYALASAEAITGRQLTVIGEAAAGHAFAGSVPQGSAVRIFTGAPLPHGTDHVEIQENVSRDGDTITLNASEPAPANVRPKGRDFDIGTELTAPRVLSAADIMLLAAMNVPQIRVAQPPQVALISTGDELVMPGENPGPDQIIASNTLGLHAMLSAAGALPRILPIARDNLDSLASAFRFARGADLIVTIGGASVGDHDLVQTAARDLGLSQSFYKVAMRPGKPLMAGKLRGVPVVGLPGNPVSALVCGRVFLMPMIRAMLGHAAEPAPRLTAPLAHDLTANGPREHYMRAALRDGALHVFERQDSSLTHLMAQADVLAIRPASDPARKAGDVLAYLPLTTG